jgi:hypothetical protein
MAYWYDHVDDTAKAFEDSVEPEFNERNPCGDEEALHEQFKYAALRAITGLMYEDLADTNESPKPYLTAENIKKCYITFRLGFPPLVILELAEMPGDKGWRETELVEFPWHPQPAYSAEWTAAEFQYRLARE